MLRIRPATFEDAVAISHLNGRNGMGLLDAIAWRECWDGHPFAAEFREIPNGWVLETDDGSVVGNLDNVHLLYEIGGRRIKAAIAAVWAVDAEHRGKSLQLIITFLRQRGVDLALVLSASSATAQILTSMKVPRIPIPDYATPCFWPVNRRAFAKAVLERRSTPGASVLAWPAGLALFVNDFCRGRGRARESSPVRRLQEFDDRFDGLWQRINAGPTRLRAVRTRAVLEWRFGSELRAGRAAILAAEQKGVLVGYAVVRHRAGTELGMKLCDVADIQAAGDDPATMKDLLLGSIRIAGEEGADAVKFVTGTPAKRAPAEALRPYTYQMPLWQMYYKAAPELSAALSTAASWDISLFDTY